MKKIYLLAGLALLTCPLFAQRTLLHCGNLFTGTGNDVQPQMTVVVEGNKITGIQKGYTAASGQDRVVDLKNKTVLPGLIDMHVHLETETRRGGLIDRFTLNTPDVAFQAAKNAKTTLLAGFTTVRDLGGSGVNVALRNAVNRGLVDGPRILTVGKSIATTGGHADPTNGYRKDLMGDPGPEEGVINGPDDARKAVRQRYKDGADLIKITATGGVLSNAKDGSGPQFTEEEAKAIVDAANDYGFAVAAHAHGAEGMKRAIRAGVQTIEHGTYMDDETISLFKKHGTYYVPTIIAGKTVADSAKMFGYYTALVTPKALAVGPKIQATFGKAYKAGVNIAFGTDAGVFVHGYNAKEFEYMVEAGMPPVEAIKAAMLTNAKLLKMDTQIGSIETGKFADMIAVDENPIKNIKTLQTVRFVMKDGKVYKE
ncbi:metal-dependent hydrolase family protein [Spirosoma sp. KUDC1026]|uniref:metal-dependent hydrolase family protein n=1 Tax=Spirosoma sp. KUDC1026 TaxID=2745947 RepID=UPI00159BCE9D|nr:amidohydrolase family protein [Spirosoma sp. KUDC1026]QKZ13253.1 amidohydrolase family protein [Spirosoma sp. KUDC1026]